MGRHRTFDPVPRTAIQASVAQAEHSADRTREFSYQGKHRERVSHSRDELPGSHVVDEGSKVGDGALVAKVDGVYPSSGWIKTDKL